MTGAQLSGIAGDVSEMSKEQMEIFMEKVAGPAFEESVEAFGLVQDWADDKAPIVLAKAKGRYQRVGRRAVRQGQHPRVEDPCRGDPGSLRGDPCHHRSGRRDDGATGVGPRR